MGIIFYSMMYDLQATIYLDLVDWEEEQKTEPPLTMPFSDDIILSALEKPLILQNYPNHTQTVERNVPVVTESCLQKVGYSGRHRWILSTLLSRWSS